VFEAIACAGLLEEVHAGLHKPYFHARVSSGEAHEIVEAIQAAAVMLADPVAPPRVVRDPGDDYIVALALAASGDAIVSGRP
jgi:uncharacterized protein